MQYYVGKNGRQLGPFTEMQVQDGTASGEFSGTDLVWREGMANWEPLGTIFPLGGSANPYQPSAAVMSGAGGAAFVGDGTVPAGRGVRLGAYLLDNFLVFLVFLPVMPFYLWYVRASMEGRAISGEEILSRLSWEMFFLSAVSGLGLLVWNLVWLTTRGQTIGKRLTGIRVVRFEDGGNAGFVKAGLVRTVLMIVPRALMGIFWDILDALFIFRDDRRCLHDLIAKTKVVNVTNTGV